MSKAATIAEKLAQGMERAEEVGECLEWQGPFNCKGSTPCVKAKDPNKDPATRRTDNFSVTRLLWEKHHGPIPTGKRVYRTCCNNACVLIDHLRCGTYKEWQKARKKTGASKHSPAARLALTLGARRRGNVKNSMDKARQVRQLAAADVPNEQIAEQTGVSIWMIADIRQNNAWKELSSPFAGLMA